ncbi:MAG: hypothetical protein ABJN34_14870 [Litoreibacter sp.]|uniref:hypothetical protein n=1 Tax=Litoreibacter sp. TaxID=1969459 RepID=UPI003297F225
MMKKENFGVVAAVAIIVVGVAFAGYKVATAEPQIDTAKVVREYERQIDENYIKVLANFKLGTFRGTYADVANSQFQGMQFSVVPNSVSCSVTDSGFMTSRYICKVDLDISGNDKAMEIAQKDGASMRGIWTINSLNSRMTFNRIWH